MKTKTSSGLKVKAGIKGGAMHPNHSHSGLKVKAGIKGGAMHPNHNRSGLKVKAGIKAAGILRENHSARLLSVA